MYFRLMRKRILLSLFLVVGVLASEAQQFEHFLADPDGRVREHQVDVTHMLVDVKFEPKEGKVIGAVEHTFTPLRKQVDTIFWDGPGIEIKSVKLLGKKVSTPVEFVTNTEGLVTKFSKSLTWDNEYKLRIEYEATPQKGIYFIGWNSPKVTNSKYQTRQQIWTQGQGIDNRHWIPMYDNMNDKFVTETIVHFAEEFNVLSNGELVKEKDNKDGNKTWHYKMPKPHAGYLLMLAIDRFAVKETETSRGTPVQFWYYPEYKDDALELTSLHTEKIIEFLEDETGYPYPWGSYSQVMVQDFMYGAMENTSATIFGDFFITDENSFNDRNYVSVNAHELTHQWFGDLITARSGTGTWLQESFATYYAKLFMGETYGIEEYQYNMRNEVNSALRAGEKDDIPVAHTKSGTARVYPKGSTVLHMMRYVLGDEEYKRVIAYYIKKHAFGNVESNDLEQAVQDVLGLNLDWFFDQWIYRGGEPYYHVTYKDYGTETVMTVKQNHEQNMTVGLFKMPIKCGVYYSDGSSQEKTVWVENETTDISFTHASDKEVAYVLFDIGSNVLKKVHYEKSPKELIKQLELAAQYMDRYDAVIALEGIDVEVKREALQKAFKREKHYGIQAAIVKQLVSDNKSARFLNTELPKADVRVKRVVLNDCDNVDGLKSIFESGLADKSYMNQSQALKCLCESGSQNKDAYFERTKEVIGRGHDVRITWLTYKIDQLKSDSVAMLRDKNSNYYKHLNELTSYSSNLYEFRTRLSAMASIKKFNYLNAQAIVNILDACLSNNRRLSSPAVATLKWYNEQYPMEKAIQAVFDQYPFTKEQRTKLRSLGVVD